MRKILIIGGVVLALIALPFALTSLGLVHKETFGVWNADVDREIYKKNQSHVEGTISHLTRLRLDYETSESDNQRSALARMMKTEASRVSQEDLPYELRTFINNL